jgi:ABC-2 type transport system permease protein
MSPIKIQAVARKEFYHLIRDFRSLYLAFAIPLLLILLFGYALSLDVDNIETVVVDYDRTDLSRDLIRKLDSTSYFHVREQLPNTRTLSQYLDHGRATMGIVIASGWTADIRADREGAIQVLLDGTDPNHAGLSRSYITSFIEKYNRERQKEFLNRQGVQQINIPIEAEIRVWFNEDLESRNFIIPGIIAIIIMIVCAILTSLVIAREYENGTMETIRSMPIGAEDFLAGKAAAYFVIGFIDLLVAVFMGQVLFGIVMKSSFWLMVLASFLYIGVALSIGFLISTVTKSQLVANQMAILVTYLPSLLLSNFVFPVENMPEVLRKITLIVPATYYIDILNGLYLRHLGLTQLWKSYMMLLLMSLFLGLINLKILKKEGL